MLIRIGLFLLSNIAVILLLTIVLYALELFFGVSLTWYSYLLVVALVFWFWGSFLSLAISRWVAKKVYKISPVSIDEYYNLNDKQKIVFDLVQDLSERNHIKMPEVWFYIDSEPNAFATWPSKNKSLVAVSSWLLDLMDKDAIEWVVGHEMAHILNWDMVTMTLLQWVVNTFVIFISKIVANIASNFVDEKYSFIVRFLVDILLQILLWVLASLITMAFSRHREFRADAWSANFVWKEKMIAWLKALKSMKDKMHEHENPRFATMQISTKSKSWFLKYFSSHPDLDDRIIALENLIIK